MENRKVMVIGLDGATWDLLEPWARNNKLPALKELMEKGCYGPLESTIPHVTPPAWTSMVTGKNPAKHGVFDFMGIKREKDGWSLSLYTSRSKRSREIWDYLNGKSIVVNVPLTYPPREINGIMVTGMYTPDINSEFTYPREIKEDILKLFPDYKIELSWAEYEGKKQKFLEDLYKMTEERVNLFWHFFEMDWNFFFFVFVGTDRLQHIVWDEGELLKYYRYLDDFLGEVIEKIREDRTNLLLVSDHGFAKIIKEVHINSILHQEGYLKLKTGQMSGFLRKLGLSKEGLTKILLKYKLNKFYDRLPPRVLHIVRKTIPGRSNPVYDFDLKNSKAIMVGTGSIYITEDNKHQKKEIEKEIIEKLENLTDPDTGEKIIERVFRKEEVYSGNLMSKAPDLIILPKKGYSLIHNVSDIAVEKPQFKKADHALNGIFLAYGPDIKEGIQIRGAKIYDIAPTILHMFGLPIPDDMDGRVLKEIFKEGSEPARREVKYQQVDVERERVKDTIRRLKKSRKL